MAKSSGKSGAMSPEQFIEKWSQSELSERAASQEHFIDLCRLIGEPTPAESDPTGESYCFEKAVKVVGAASKGSKGELGFVDVWKKGRFAWEYKRKDKYKSLDETYRQLYQYRDALDNPPLSVVCDIRNFVIRTHFPGYPTAKIEIRLEELPGKLDLFRRIFNAPETFRPSKDREETTKEIAEVFADVANALIKRHLSDDMSLWTSPGDPVAHFLMKVMFCLFAEDIGQLPPNLFTRLIDRCLFDPEQFQPLVADLFEKMKKGGWYGSDKIEYFNGGLFDDAPPLALKDADVRLLRTIAEKPWAGVEPTIFGTLFERILDPQKRAQIGAHYTSKEDILLVVEPVVMAPLRREWEALKATLKGDLEKHDAQPDRKKRDLLSASVKLGVEGFRQRLSKIRVLDPACGSGNFLYVTLQRLLDLEDEIVRFCALHDIYVDPVPRIRPPQMHGIEINPYAAELAQVVIWIGYLQWLHEHNIDDPRRPILDKLQCIENRDAILDLSDKDNPAPATWPEADFIVGNPPFLGGSMIWESMGTDYRNALWKAYNISNFSDLCCYWFEQGKFIIQQRPDVRCGLLATQAIRGGVNRKVLESLKIVGDIFMAWADRNWILDGASVHVSIVGFDGAAEKQRRLNGDIVNEINANLTSGLDLTVAVELQENLNLCLIGVKKAGPFDLSFEIARTLLARGGNVNGHSNSDVLRQTLNGRGMTGRPFGNWIVDFGHDMTEAEASKYEAPFEYVRSNVLPERKQNKRALYRNRWWLYAETRPTMREAQRVYARCVATAYVTKHRLFAWLDSRCVPADGLFIFARCDNYFIGMLHSSIHEVWTRRMGTQLREVESGFRYTPTTCFETFPLPWPPGKEDVKHPAYARIGEAAKGLNDLRERWLNPPEWIDLIAQQIDERDKFEDVPKEARPLIRQSAIMAAAAKDSRLKSRTLTNLYNERPTWLKLAHQKLDQAVLAAYAATDPAGGWDEAWAEVWVETGAGQPLSAEHPDRQKRAQVDQQVLSALLALNHRRAGKEAGR